MATINCALSLGELIPLAAEKGLSSNDVLEAQFVHILQTLLLPQVADWVQKTTENILAVHNSEQTLVQMTDADKTAQLFIMSLPDRYVQMADLMIEHGGLSVERGTQNWAVVEAVMADNDPDMKRYLEERDGKPAGIQFH